MNKDIHTTYGNTPNYRQATYGKITEEGHIPKDNEYIKDLHTPEDGHTSK